MTYPGTVRRDMTSLESSLVSRVTELERERDELVEALRPFAKFACDTPHVNEPVCHNCRARNALAKQGG